MTATANTPATANAGGDASVGSGGAGSLDGSGSSANDMGQMLTYAWSQTAGTAVTLTGAATATPSFTAPILAIGAADETLTFSLIVNDGFGNSAPDTVDITVTALDVIPPAPAAQVTITTLEDGAILVSGVVEAGATVEVTMPDGIMISAVANASGGFVATSAPDQPSGEVKIVVIDAAGNRSEVKTTAYVAPVFVADTQAAIADYMSARAGHVIRAQPDLTGLLSGQADGAFNANVTRGHGQFEFETAGSQPVWAQLQGNWSTEGNIENSYFFGAVGAHATVSPNFLVGVLFEFDTLKQVDGTTTVEGDGYLVGPYFVAKLPEQPLYFEGRFLKGATQNELSVDGAAMQAFETRRSLASVKVAGQLEYGLTTLTPSLTASRYTDTQLGFTDNASQEIPEQSITVSDFAAGLDFSHPFGMDDGLLTITGGIAGIWSETSGTGYATDVIPAYDGGRAKVQLGVRYALENGVDLTVGGSYDGIGANDFEAWGLNAGIAMKF